MSGDQRIAVALALTPDPSLLPVVQGVVASLAEQVGFGESQRLNLQQGVERACRRWMEAGSGKAEASLRLEFAAFPDRLEVVLEDGGEAGEADSFLLTHLLDRVSSEEIGGGRQRLTLVKFL